MGGGIAPGLPLRIPKMRHPRKLRKKKLHIIYLKGTHKKGGPKKKLQGCCFGTGGYCGVLLWESMLVQGVVLWVYCGHHFLVQMGYCGNHVWYRGCTVGVRWESFLVKKGVQWVAFLVQGVVVWVYCGKQFLVLRVCTVGRIFGTGGGSVGVLWEAVFGTEVCTMGGTFDTEGICGHPCLVLWQ